MENGFFIFTAVAWLRYMTVAIPADVIVSFYLSRMNKCIVNDGHEVHVL